jgi:hypothetical protein
LLRYLKDFSISSGTKLNLFNKELNWFLKVHDCKRYANACLPCSIFFTIVAIFLYTRKKLANELQKRKHENVDCPHDCSSSIYMFIDKHWPSQFISVCFFFFRKYLFLSTLSTLSASLYLFIYQKNKINCIGK